MVTWSLRPKSLRAQSRSTGSAFAGTAQRWLGGVGLVWAVGALAPQAARAQLPPNVPYDGRPVLARIRFPAVADPPGCQDPDGLGDGGWSHDYPMGVQGMMKGATEVTSLEAPVDSFMTVMSVTDREFMKYPVAMVTEPGCWNPSEQEVKALREYLEKGGFLLLDDLTFGDGAPMHMELAIARLEAWMKRVLPSAKLVPVPASDPIFRGFFQISPAEVPGAGSSAETGGALYGVYRNNDPSQRLMAVATYRGVMGHFWRWQEGTGSGLGDANSPQGKAYRLGLNILVYSLSH